MLKSCSYCGCIHKVGYACPKKPKREYKGELADDRKIYATHKWNKLKAQVEQEQEYICLFSMYVVGKVRQCNVTHHIVTIHDSIKQAFEESNLIGLDREVHKCVHELYKIDMALIQGILRECKQMWNEGIRGDGLGKLKNKLNREMMDIVDIYC